MPEFRGIRIYEEYLICQDCEEGNPTHNEYHLPHTNLVYFFNNQTPEIPGDYRLIEEWTEDELTDEVLDGLSWTQFAIKECA